MATEQRFVNLEWIFNRVFQFFARIFGGGEASVDTSFEGPQGLFGLLKRGADSGSLFGNVRDTLSFFVGIIVPLLILLFGVLFVYYKIKMQELKKREHHRLMARIYKRQKENTETPQNPQWERVVALFHSEQSSDWRVAIIEADTMLEDLVTQLGYTGESLGEKMKGIDPGNFPYLRDAWDAHIVRNKIAHEGINFMIDTFEKNRVFRLYEKVFSEAGYI
jgi:hypothetical protein